jgi:hypothetical protein
MERRLAFGKVVCLFALLALVASVAWSAPVQDSQGRPAGDAGALSNDAVIKLVALDLGDEVVIAKINQAPAVAFKLDTDDLINLKQRGVSRDVIAAMLKRASPPQATPSTVASEPQSGAQLTSASRVASDIRLVTSTGDTLLRTTIGDINIVGFSFVKFAYYEVPGTESRIRTPDRNARVAISADFMPEGYFFLMALDVDRKHNNRAMKLGSAKQSSSFRSRSKGKPDLDNAVKCKIEKVTDTEWQLVPESPLKPGEYGVWAAARAQGTEGLYDFGVD